MNLTENAKLALEPLQELLLQMRQGDYSRELSVLMGNTVGKHVRHVIEFFQCMEKGYYSGAVDYEARVRNPILEHDLFAAIDAMKEVIEELKGKEDRALSMRMVLDGTKEVVELGTTYYRELAYNIEHTFHHLAIIRIAVEQELKELRVGSTFGYASSTVRYNKGQ